MARPAPVSNEAAAAPGPVKPRSRQPGDRHEGRLAYDDSAIARAAGETRAGPFGAYVPDPVRPRVRHLALFMHGFEDGGAQRRTLTLAGALLAYGMRVDLLVANHEGPLRTSVPEGVNVVVLPSRGRKPFWRVRLAVPALVEWLRRERPDVFAAAANHAVLAAVAAHRRAELPETALVLRVSNALIAQRTRLTDPIKRWSWRRALPQADGVATVATALQDEVLQLSPALAGRVRTVPNPVIGSRDDQADAATLPAWFPSSNPVILGVGRLVEQKDFPTLIRAFATLRQTGVGTPAAKLVILGEGPRRKELLTLAASLGVGGDVLLPGFVANPTPIMRAATVTVLSSRWEGMPGTLIEAMAEGCPVVSTDCAGGSRELLEQGRLGALAPVGDATALAAAIGQTLGQAVDRQALRRRASDFTIDNACREFHKVLKAAMVHAAERRRAMTLNPAFDTGQAASPEASGWDHSEAA